MEFVISTIGTERTGKLAAPKFGQAIKSGEADHPIDCVSRLALADRSVRISTISRATGKARGWPPEISGAFLTRQPLTRKLQTAADAGERWNGARNERETA